MSSMCILYLAYTVYIHDTKSQFYNRMVDDIKFQLSDRLVIY